MLAQRNGSRQGLNVKRLPSTAPNLRSVASSAIFIDVRHSVRANPSSDRGFRSIKPSRRHLRQALHPKEAVVSNTMRALVLRKHGGLDDLAVVDDHPRPSASEGH